MGHRTIVSLIETRKEIIRQVNQEVLAVGTAAAILGVTRQALWKMRKRVAAWGLEAAIGRKRGPKGYHRVWNRTPAWLEEKVEDLFHATGVGPDRLCWLLEDVSVSLSRATVYRILVRRRLIARRMRGKRAPVTLYSKGFPGEEVQMDTTQPLGKSGPTLMSAIDDYSRWGTAECYRGNTSLQAAAFLRRLVSTAPFPIAAVRVDNGSEFSGAFIRECRTLGIELIRNPVRHPTSNGKVERFHRIIEEECFWRVGAEPDNLEYARYWLSRYLAWYNTKRVHGGYGICGRTPQERIEDWIMDNSVDSLLYRRDVNETLILYTS
jgi:transposase InsO family protein